MVFQNHQSLYFQGQNTNVKKVLDGVLPGYAKSGGTFTRAVCKYGKHTFLAMICLFLAAGTFIPFCAT